MAKDETKKLKEIMILAGEEAKRLGNSKISPEHLFLGILRLKQAWAIDVLIALGIDFYEVRNKIERKLNKQRDKNEEIPETLDYTLAANSILRRVAEEAWKLGDEEVESEHLMLAMLRNQASELLWYGKITTTEARAKALQPYVEKIITKAIKVYDDNVETKVTTRIRKARTLPPNL